VSSDPTAARDRLRSRRLTERDLGPTARSVFVDLFSWKTRQCHRLRVVDGMAPQQLWRDRTFERPSGVNDPGRVLQRVFALDVRRLRVSRFRLEGIDGAPKQLVHQLAEFVRRDGQRVLALPRDVETQSVLPDVSQRISQESL